jgi:hypothetical protein
MNIWYVRNQAARGDVLRSARNVANMTGQEQTVEYQPPLRKLMADGTTLLIESERIEANPESPYQLGA